MSVWSVLQSETMLMPVGTAAARATLMWVATWTYGDVWTCATVEGHVEVHGPAGISAKGQSGDHDLCCIWTMKPY